MMPQRTLMWQPSRERIGQSNLTAYLEFLEEKYGLHFKDDQALYQWSITHIADFWESIWTWFDVIHEQKYTAVLEGDDIRTAKWFTGTRLNFAENLLRYRDERVAIRYQCEDGTRLSLTYHELYQEVAKTAVAMCKAGITPGDRVAAYITNRPEAVIGMLAAASIGAVWSSCSPDFGFEGILDRFGQIEPKLLIAVNACQYNGKTLHLADTLTRIGKAIPSIRQMVIIRPLEAVTDAPENSVLWDDFLLSTDEPLVFGQFGFDHPLYIMYSSGTTGKPKCIVHGIGGTLLQHLKELGLHTDLKREDTITYYTTCGWMMWNWLVSSLAIGSTVFLYDGSPSWPGLNVLFDAIDEVGITIFGTSPKFLSSCASAGLKPIDTHDLSTLRTILSTGAPLMEHHYEYVYHHIKNDVQLSSISGGTDIISCFMLGHPHRPVYLGELQGAGLGMKVAVFNDQGNTVQDEVGELVCTSPFPSRPVGFWNDPDGKKYQEAYFSHFPGVWRHGDYVLMRPDGSCIVYGRSDATLNPGGVRIGTAEIYESVESLPEIKDSIVVGRKTGDDTAIVLFVVLNEGYSLDEALCSKIKSTLRTKKSPRHVPSEIHQVPDIPRTVSGKKVELAVTKTIHGDPIPNKEALANPESLEWFK
tara:strand:- start:227926 stop:229854 length:1929 start_codon:yes stop_codon:yes gene_type:complete